MVNSANTETILSLVHRAYIPVLTYLKVLIYKKK